MYCGSDILKLLGGCCAGKQYGFNVVGDLSN